MKINNFRGDLTDVSAKKEALVCMVYSRSIYSLKTHSFSMQLTIFELI